MKKKVMVVFGTRPEAIKLGPLIQTLAASSDFEPIAVSTGQHREMIKPILNLFGIKPDLDLDLMKPNQDLNGLASAAISGVAKAISELSPACVLVQGDTTTTFAASIAGFYAKVPVFHLEAGLRSGDMNSPFPEEFNRRVTSLTAALHLAPTEVSARNLRREGIEEGRVVITGNTAIDAVLTARDEMRSTSASEYRNVFPFLREGAPMVLVTLHRRESFERDLAVVMSAIQKFSLANSHVQILIPLHLNPNVQRIAKEVLRERVSWHGEKTADPNIFVVNPLEYHHFVYAMSRSTFIVTDSGGVQEEAPSLGVPVLVARENTERPEGLDAGVTKLLPLEEGPALALMQRMLDDEGLRESMRSSVSPYGDGKACERTVEAIRLYFSGKN